MKRFFNVIMLTLGLNFLAIAGGVGYLYSQGKLDREKVQAIREILFPPVAPAEEVKLDDGDAPATQPALQLEALLERQTGRTASEQVEFIRQTFDAQMAQLDRRQRELADLHRQVELAKQQLAADRVALDREREQLAQREQQRQQLQEDEGFQDALELYQRMPAKQAKAVFMALDDETVMRYLQAMEPRMAGKIIKEFKAPQELARIERVLEMIREGQAQAQVAPKE